MSRLRSSDADMTTEQAADNARAESDAIRSSASFAETAPQRTNEELERQISVRTEQLRQAKEAAEAACQTKTQFLAHMSHNVRTPMNGIMGLIELLADTELGEEQRDLLAMLQSSADSLMRILNDVFTYSSIESGGLDLSAAQFHVRQCIDRAIDRLSPAAASKHLALTHHVTPAVPETLYADAARLEDVLLRLIENAIEFTDRGSVVVGVDLAEQDEHYCVLQFAVRDTGCGISQQRQESIFEAFGQGDWSLSRRHNGTGLGLAIAARTVATMDGKIWVDSAPSMGSTFYFTARLALHV